PGGLGDGLHREAVLGRLIPRGRALAQPDHDVGSRVLQVEGVGVTLAAVADDRHTPFLDQSWVGVLLVVDRCHWFLFPCLQLTARSVAAPRPFVSRAMATQPDFARSTTPYGLTRSRKSLIFSGLPTTWKAIELGPTSTAVASKMEARDSSS